MIELSDTLKRCLQAGGAIGCFQVLDGVARPDLEALIKEIDQVHAIADTELNENYLKLIFDPTTFFNRTASALVDKQFKEEQLNLLAMLSEISSVALYYLDRC